MSCCKVGTANSGVPRKITRKFLIQSGLAKSILANRDGVPLKRCTFDNVIRRVCNQELSRAPIG
jgi:hypothetical protein